MAQSRKNAEQWIRRAYVKKLFIVQRCRCFYCNELLRINSVTYDHFIPQSLITHGGGGPPYNGVISCVSCNQEKRHELPSKEEARRFLQQHRQIFPSVENILRICRLTSHNKVSKL